MEDHVTSRQFDAFVQEQKEHHQRIEEGGQKRGAQIADIDRKLDSVDRWRVRMDALVNKHEHTLYGNGDPGMDEMLRELYAWMKKQKDREDGRSEITAGEIRKYVFWLITFILALLLNSWITEMLAK